MVTESEKIIWKQIDDNKIKIAKLLLQLAIVKNVERTEKQIAATAEYLSKHFEYEEISNVCEYNLQRSPYFPNLCDFFNILRPMGTVDQRAIELYGEFQTAITASGGNYHFFIQNNRPELIQFVTDFGWQNSQSMFKKDALEIFKKIVDTPSFYLSTIKGHNDEKAITES